MGSVTFGPICYRHFCIRQSRTSRSAHHPQIDDGLTSARTSVSKCHVSITSEGLRHGRAFPVGGLQGDKTCDY